MSRHQMPEQILLSPPLSTQRVTTSRRRRAPRLDFRRNEGPFVWGARWRSIATGWLRLLCNESDSRLLAVDVDVVQSDPCQSALLQARSRRAENFGWAKFCVAIARRHCVRLEASFIRHHLVSSHANRRAREIKQLHGINRNPATPGFRRPTSGFGPCKQQARLLAWPTRQRESARRRFRRRK